MLRDRLVCGIRNDQAQKKLLREVDLTLTRVLQTALSIEAADARAKEMKGGQSSILRVSSTCYGCGKPAYKAAKCHKCGKVGHILPACRWKGKKLPAGQEQQQRKARSRQDRSETTKWVDFADLSAPPTERLALTWLPLDYHCLPWAKPPQTALSRS